MITSQKTLCIIRHDKNTLPPLDYMSSREFIALSISGGVILWLNRGMSMLIPAARIINMANIVEMIGKFQSSKTKPTKPIFTADDAIVLPKRIANALLGDNE